MVLVFTWPLFQMCDKKKSLGIIAAGFFAG